MLLKQSQCSLVEVKWVIVTIGKKK